MIRTLYAALAFALMVPVVAPGAAEARPRHAHKAAKKHHAAKHAAKKRARKPAEHKRGAEF